MIGSFIENTFGQILAPDDKAPGADTNPKSLLQLVAPDPNYYGKLQNPPTAQAPPSSPTLTTSRTPTPPSAPHTPSTTTQRHQSSHLQTEVMSAAMGTADTISSPPLVWENRKNLFTLLSSTSTKSKKRISKLLAKEPSLATIRSANLANLVPDGFTPLHAAALFNNIEAARLLLSLTNPHDGSRLVSCRSTDLQGRTPLHIAAEQGFLEVVSYLKRKLGEETGVEPVGPGAPVDLVGRTPLGWAVTSRQASARKNRGGLREALFSPGDFSICPVTPATERRRGDDGGIVYGVAEMPGWRVDMEDATLEDGARGIFGVFDGHGDRGMVSAFLRDNLVAVWDEMKGESDDETRMVGVCRVLDEKLQTFSLKGGSTGVIAIIQKESVLVANVGDSRAIIVQKDGDQIKTLAMSQDHKPNLPDEKARIEAAGLAIVEETTADGQVISKVQRNDDKIALSRAFGDFDFKSNPDVKQDKQALICTPDVTFHQRCGNDLFLVLACDGVWDVMSNDDCGAFIVAKSKDGGMSLEEVGDSLLSECLAKGSEDNMSVVIVRLDQDGEVMDVTEGMKKLDFDDE